jgi:hypothetical protein
MLYELFYLVNPLGFQHIFLDRFHSDHQSCNVFDQDIITSNQKFFFFDRAGLGLGYLLLADRLHQAI